MLETTKNRNQNQTKPNQTKNKNRKPGKKHETMVVKTLNVRQ